MMLPPEQQRIVRFLAQQSEARRPEVSEAMLTYRLNMDRETLRQHIDQLEGKYVTVRKRTETQDRWVTLSSAGEDYAREHGMM
jgi:DNA-binding MarR family transcriptional regulator